MTWPESLRNFDRHVHDGLVLDDVRDLKFLVEQQPPKELAVVVLRCGIYWPDRWAFLRSNSCISIDEEYQRQVGLGSC